MSKIGQSIHEKQHHEIDELIIQFKAHDIGIQNRIQALGNQLAAERKFQEAFEERLAAMGKNIDEWQTDDNTIEEWDKGYESAYKRISAIYRECRERIQNNREEE